MISYFYILLYTLIKKTTHQHFALIYFQSIDVLTILTHFDDIFKIANTSVLNYVYWVDLQK